MSNSSFLPPAIDPLTMAEADFVKHIHDNVFVPDFLETKTTYLGNNLSIKKNPFRNGYCATFWHMITEGFDENSRTVVLDRCYKLPWAKSIIDNCTHNNVVSWENTRKGKTRICLWHNRWSSGTAPVDSYVVIIEKRVESSGNLILIPWTAYPVDRLHTAKKLEKEYQASLAGVI